MGNGECQREVHGLSRPGGNFTQAEIDLVNQKTVYRYYLNWVLQEGRYEAEADAASALYAAFYAERLGTVVPIRTEENG